MELDKYAHGLNEEDQIERFRGGLEDHIKDKVQTFMSKTMIEVIQRTRFNGTDAQRKNELSGNLNQKVNNQEN